MFEAQWAQTSMARILCPRLLRRRLQLLELDARLEGRSAAEWWQGFFILAARLFAVTVLSGCYSAHLPRAILGSI